MKITELDALLKRAFDAGFDASQEGFNGEYIDPYDKENDRLGRERGCKIQELMQGVELAPP